MQRIFSQRHLDRVESRWIHIQIRDVRAQRGEATIVSCNLGVRSRNSLFPNVPHRPLSDGGSAYKINFTPGVVATAVVAESATSMHPCGVLLPRSRIPSMPNGYRSVFNDPQRIDVVWLSKFFGGCVVGLGTFLGRWGRSIDSPFRPPFLMRLH